MLTANGARARLAAVGTSTTVLALLWVLAVAALATWLTATPTPWLREHLKRLQFWSLEVCVVLGLSIAIMLVRDVRRVLERRDTVKMVGLAALAVALTLFVPPRTNRIYYDEHIYQGVAQNLADRKLAQMCNDGTVEYGRLQCWSGEYNKQPYAYPHLLSLGYRVVGVVPDLAFGFNAIANGLTVATLYLLVILLFGNRDAAFLAGLIMTLTPHQVIWSATASVEPSASLACIVALLAAAMYLRLGSLASLAGVAVATAYAVQFRPESLLIVPVIGVLLWPRVRRERFGRRFWWVGLLFLALLAVHVGHLAAVRAEGWGTTDARLSLRHVPSNFAVNGLFYVGDERYPVVFTLLAVAGLARRPLGTARAAMIAYFLLFFGIYLLFYAGSYNYGADVRYSLLTYPPLAVLGGLGAARLAASLQQRAPGVRARRVVAAGLLFQFLWYVPLVRATTEEAWAARADVRFARSLVPALRGNTYVLTHNPGMFHLWSVNAGQLSLAANSGVYVDYLLGRYRGGVYVHWNFWCNAQDPIQQEYCRNVITTIPVRLVREYREREQRFALYRVDLRGEAQPSRPAH